MNKLLIRKFCTVAKKESLVVVGTGWAGYKFLQSINPEKYNVTVVSPRNHFVFTPLLASTSVGTLEFRCISEPVRALKKKLTYYEASATTIDTDKKTLQCENTLNKGEFTVQYDKLVIACGAISNTFNTPGVTENAFFLKEIADARNIRQRIIDRFELASEPNVGDEERKGLLHFAVVGGGPTGIELSAELHDFIVDDVNRQYPHLANIAQVTVYDVSDRILGAFDEKLSQYAMKKFNRDGIEIKTQTRIREVKSDRLVFADSSESMVGMVVWATGLGPNNFIKELPFPKDKSQRVLTDGFLHIMRDNREPLKDVFALGDCATIENYNLAQTAQVAKQKGHYLAKVLNESSKSPAPFVYHHMGAMAYIGNWKALVDSPTNFKGSGYLAWLIWRSSYFTMTVSWRNKLLIPSYWFLTWLSGRDTTRF